MDVKYKLAQFTSS